MIGAAVIPTTTPIADLALSEGTRSMAGILLLTVVAVEFGGVTMLRIVRGSRPATGFQRSFARAGHAHAGVFVVFALVALLFADSADLHGLIDAVARSGIWVAAILCPAGFFLSSAGEGATEPNRMIALVYLGILALTAGVLALGIGLLTA
jgi:hypothetical protein